MSREEVIRRTRERLASEPLLTALGVAGGLLALICLAGVAVHGPVRAPEGKLLDAATFDFGVGLFLLTIALVLPLAAFPDRSRRILRRFFLAFGTYGLLIETVQAFRGMDPRFSPLHTPVDAVAGGLFGLNALFLTLATLVLGARFFRDDVLPDRPVLRLRYGSVAVALSFGVGVVMSAVQGREIGIAGDLLPAHGLGIHGIQVLPVAALLLVWAGFPRASRAMHLVGAGWLVAVLAVLAHALLGRPTAEPSALLATAAAGLLVSAGLTLRAAWAWAWWSAERAVAGGVRAP